MPADTPSRTNVMMPLGPGRPPEHTHAAKNEQDHEFAMGSSRPFGDMAVPSLPSSPGGPFASHATRGFAGGRSGAISRKMSAEPLLPMVSRRFER